MVSLKQLSALTLFVIAILPGCASGAPSGIRKGRSSNVSSEDEEVSVEDSPRYQLTEEELEVILAQASFDETQWSEEEQEDDYDFEASIDEVAPRKLQSPALFQPLACNAGVDFDTLTCSLLSSFPQTGALVIPCATCVEVDTTDGSTITYIGGVTISGMLRFPPTANVVIHTTSVIVEGKLKIETPNAGNQVKFSMYGQTDYHYITPGAGSLCEGPDGCNMGSQAIAVIGGQLDINGYGSSCPSWEKLQDVNTALTELTVSPEAAACWGAGTELVLTSHTRSMHDRQVVTVTSTGTNTITLSSPIVKPVTLADSADFAIEIASLDRPVVFEGTPDAGSGATNGGHLIVYATAAAQHIEGASFRYFGNQGKLGRYPIHFHLSGDHPNSMVKKNVVRDSFQRGYVLHGTNDVTLEDNVAFDVVGHCYFLENASEERNTFTRNLGLGIVNMPAISVDALREDSNDIISDDKASVFWISNPRNSFYGNVVAGSDHFGIWFECRGPQMFMTSIAFEDNEIHSCLGVAFTPYDPGWRPATPAIIENLKVYRNYGNGAFLHVVENLHFNGGIFADNGWMAVYVLRGDNIVFEGTKFIGATEFAEPFHFCNFGSSILGMRIDATKLNQFDYAQEYQGTTLSNVEFSNFSPATSGCGVDTAPMDIGVYQAFYEAWYARHNFYNVKLDAGTTLQSCDANYYYNIDTVAIEISSDAHASFDSSGSPGFLASPVVADFVGGCTNYGDNCLKYCANACLRIVRVLASAASPLGDTDMIVTNVATGDQILVTRDLYGGVADSVFLDAFYTTALPAGSYEISFVDTNGDPVYPNFAVPILEAPPTCGSYVEYGDFVVIRPEPDRDVCDDLIFNGDFDVDIFGWQGAFSNNVWSATAGVDGGGALETTTRYDVNVYYPAQWIDASCVQAGNSYLLNLEYMNSDGVAPCTTGANVDCPTVAIRFQNFDQATGVWVHPTGASPLYYTTNQPSPDGSAFSKVTATWNPTEAEANADRVQIIVTQGSGNIIIDNFHLERVFGANQLVDSGFESGTANGFWGWGNPIAVTTPGYDGSAYALEATRPAQASGQYRDLYHYLYDTAITIEEEDTWRISFKVRLLDATTNAGVSCTPSAGDFTCPTATAVGMTGPNLGSATSTSTIIHDTDMTWDANGWNTFDETVYITEGMAGPDLLIFRVLINGGPAGARMVIDDVVFAKQIRGQTGRLDVCAVNHIGSGGAFVSGVILPWWGWGNTIQVRQPGYGGTDYALEALRPNNYNDGMFTDVFGPWKDTPYLQLCVQEGDVWRVSFKTRLLDEVDDNVGVACDPSLGDNNCPFVVVHTMKGPNMGSATSEFVDLKDTAMAWNAASWNTFDTTFTVTASQAGADLVNFRLFIRGGPVGARLVIDDVVATVESLGGSR